MASFGIAVLQSLVFAVMLVMLGAISWHECQLTGWQIALVIALFALAAATLSVIFGALKCLTVLCVACPEMPMLKAFLSACYGTVLFIAIIAVEGNCGGSHVYVGVGAMLYSVLILIFFFQVCGEVDKDI